MITVNHPIYKDISINFNEDDHTYIDNRGFRYRSVSGLISEFFEPFDTDIIAERCSIKRGVSKESLINEWKEAGRVAADKGHNVHDMLRCKFLGLEFDKIEPNYIKEVDRIYSSVIKIVDPVYIETILFDPLLLIAGTCDGVFITKDFSKYVVIDWKTSKSINNNSYGKFGLKSLIDIPDCNYVHYSIQLQIYSHLLKTNGYLKYNIPIQHRLIHIKEKDSSSMKIMKINIIKLLSNDLE